MDPSGAVGEGQKEMKNMVLETRGKSILDLQGQNSWHSCVLQLGDEFRN